MIFIIFNNTSILIPGYYEENCESVKNPCEGHGCQFSCVRPASNSQDPTVPICECPSGKCFDSMDSLL